MAGGNDRAPPDSQTGRVGSIPRGGWNTSAITRADPLDRAAPHRVRARRPARLHGTLHTQHGDFSGFIQWNRRSGVSSDELAGRGADDQVTLRFDTIRSIARRTDDSAVVTLLDGRELVLSGTRDACDGSGGIYVDDRRGSNSTGRRQCTRRPHVDARAGTLA